MALLKPVMALGTSSLLTQLSIVVITVVNNILLVKYGAGSVYGADIPLAAVAAQENGLAQDFISGINSDENAVMRELYLTADPVKRAVAAQEKAIRHIADAGSCVIIGRSADYVLRHYPDVVRIFIYAPESYRQKKVMEMYGDSPEAAKKSIARSDAARGAYYKSVSGQEWGNPHGYELCIDASVGEEAAADMICSYITRMGRS